MFSSTTPRGPGPDFLAWLGLLGLAMVLAFVFQGARGLWEPDEGRYAEVAREMLASSNFVMPSLDGRPHLTKPPLTYWAIAASIRAFGTGEGAVRLYLSLSFAATVLLVAALGARIWDRGTGLRAGLVYATAILPFAAASVATPDTLLALWAALALYAFWRGFEAETRAGRWAWPTLTGAAFGLAFLTKGPAGLIFLPVMFVFRRLAPGRRAGAAPILNWSGGILLVSLGAAWFVAVLWHDGGLAGYFVRDEFLGRLAGQHHRNSGWYGWIVIYGPALLGGALPWSLVWPRIGRRLRAAARPRGIVTWVRRRPAPLFLALSILIPLVMFCAIRSRLVFYVLPIFIPLALATARGLTMAGGAGCDSTLSRRAWRPALAAWVVFLLASRLALAHWPLDRDARALYRALPDMRGAEIVVDDHRAHPGLEYYAGCDLEYVHLPLAAPNAKLVTKSLTDELQEESAGTDHGHVYVFEAEHAADLEAQLHAAQARVVTIKAVPGFVVVVTDPPPA